MKNISFDFDGTLVDKTEEAKMAAFFQCVEEFGRQSDHDALLEWLGDEQKRLQIYQSWDNTETRMMTFPTGKLKEAFLQYYKERRDDTHIEVVRNSPLIQLYPEVRRVLESLGDSQWAIFTDSSRKQVWAIMDKLPWLQEFFREKLIITQNDVTMRKPDPQGLHTIMKRFWCTGKDMIHIGDGWWDVEAAIRAKIQQIFLLEREWEIRTPKHDEHDLWLHTGEIMRARTLNILTQKRKPFVMILRGRQYVWKWFISSHLPVPVALINKDYVAEKYGMCRRNWVEYTSKIRTRLYKLFTKTALRRIKQYGYVCLDAPFTFQDDVDKMIEELRAIYPDMPVLVTTVEAPEEDRRARAESPRNLRGMMWQNPPHDVFHTKYADTIDTKGDSNTIALNINNLNGWNPEEILRPIREAIKKFSL